MSYVMTYLNAIIFIAIVLGTFIGVYLLVRSSFEDK